MSDRGIRLGDLDPDQAYVIQRVRKPKGWRWEVVGIADRRMAVENASPAHASAHSRLGASQLDPGEI